MLHAHLFQSQLCINLGSKIIIITNLLYTTYFCIHTAPLSIQKYYTIPRFSRLLFHNNYPSKNWNPSKLNRFPAILESHFSVLPWRLDSVVTVAKAKDISLSHPLPPWVSAALSRHCDVIQEAEWIVAVAMANTASYAINLWNSTTHL